MRSTSSPAKSDRLRSLRVPLLQAFREAALSGDGRRSKADQAGTTGTRAPQARQSASNEALLRESLDLDLGHLFNTVNLASTLDLSAHPRTARSVLNFGMQDLVHLTTDSVRLPDLTNALKVALLAHEPRLNAATLTISQKEDLDEVNQRIAFSVQADMLCDPVDVPLEFLAEIDVGSGKVDLRNLARHRQTRGTATPGRGAAATAHVPPGSEMPLKSATKPADG